jgi:hypothetical protein
MDMRAFEAEDRVLGEEAEEALGNLSLAGQCASHIAWAFAQQGGGEGEGEGEAAPDGPGMLLSSRGGSADADQTYCYLCETKDDPENVYRTQVRLLMRAVGSKSPYYVCRSVAEYYRTEIMPYHLVDGRQKVWDEQSVYRHIFEHEIDPETVYLQSIRQCNEYDRDMSRTSRMVDADGQPAPPNSMLLRMHMQIIRQREASLQHLLTYRRLQARQ